MDYTRNEDKLCRSASISGAAYNIIHSIADAASDTIPNEPVNGNEMKNYLRLEGFEPGSEFNFDDLLIEDMIQEARIWVEAYTRQLVVRRDIVVLISNEAGMIELPGPVNGSVVFDGEDSPVDVEAKAGRMVTTGSNMLITYNAGYENAPAWARNAIKAYVAWAFENRGDETAGNPTRAAAICRPHIKGQKWA